MSTGANPRKGPLAIVLGCDHVGSAVAHALHRAGLAVVVVDSIDPPWCRRGMAYTNAWYLGNAELDGEAACFCASLKSIPAVLSRGLIAATTWSWSGVAAGLAAQIAVDARPATSAERCALRGRVAHAVGVGEGFVAGAGVDVAVDGVCSEDTGAMRADGAYFVRRGARGECRSPGRSVQAERDGRFFTRHRIGDRVSAGDIVGRLHADPVIAPCDGVLCGLSAHGARVGIAQTIVEVDPRGDPTLCYGIGEEPSRAAQRVARALELRGVIAKHSIPPV